MCRNGLAHWRGLRRNGRISSPSKAERCNVSQTSVMRFARHLGFDGFAEMKQVFQKDLREAAQKNMQSITYGYCAPFVVV
jgi:DNA-binding MurR/RpiR family transcriptional regulator